MLLHASNSSNDHLDFPDPNHRFSLDSSLQAHSSMSDGIGAANHTFETTHKHMGIQGVPKTNSNHYNLDKFKYKLLNCIYDMLIIVLSILDTLCNMWVIVEFYYQHDSTHEAVHQVFLIILLIWSGFIQIVYIFLFVNHSYNDCFCCFRLGFAIIIAPIIPIAHYLAFVSGVADDWNALFPSIDYNEPLWKQFCAVSRNKHAGFMIQTFGESIPSAIIQTIALIYQSNKDIKNDGDSDFDGPKLVSGLRFCLCVSIASTFTTAMLKLPLLIDWTRVTNTWLLFNHLCVICDILCFFTAIVWIFYNNDNLFAYNYDTSDTSSFLVTFFTNINDNLPKYQSLWIYTVIIGLLPTIGTAIIFGTLAGIVYFVGAFLVNCSECNRCETLLVVIVGPLGGTIVAIFAIICLFFATIFGQLCCWSGIGLLIFDLNKFEFQTKYDSILWNHFLCESTIIKRDKRLAIIAINYSLLRRYVERSRWYYRVFLHDEFDSDISINYDYARFSDLSTDKNENNDSNNNKPKNKHRNCNSNGTEFESKHLRRYLLLTRRQSNRELKDYLLQTAKAETAKLTNQRNEIKNKQERLKNNLNRRLMGLRNSFSYSININTHHDECSSNSFTSTIVNAVTKEITQNEEEYQKKLALTYSQPMKDLTFAKLRSFTSSQYAHTRIGKMVKNRLLFLMIEMRYRGYLASLFALWMELIGVFPYVLTRIVIMAFPFIIVFSHIIPKIKNNNGGIKWYYKNEIMNNSENICKHLLMISNIVCYLIMLLLLIFHVLPIFYYSYHILPGKRRVPSVDSLDKFEYLFCDIYACYDVLFVSRIREYYVLQYFGDDIGGIILQYIGIGKGCDIQQMIDSMNPKITDIIHEKKEKDNNDNKKNDDSKLDNLFDNRSESGFYLPNGLIKGSIAWS